MRVDVSCKYLERSELIDTVLEHDLHKIERRVKIFRQDAPIHISVHIEKNPHKEQYFCRTQVYLPSKVLTAGNKGDDLTVVINKVFSALAKQLEKIKDRREGHLRKRRASRIKPEE